MEEQVKNIAGSSRGKKWYKTSILRVIIIIFSIPIAIFIFVGVLGHGDSWPRPVIRVKVVDESGQPVKGALVVFISDHEKDMMKDPEIRPDLFKYKDDGEIGITDEIGVTNIRSRFGVATYLLFYKQIYSRGRLVLVEKQGYKTKEIYIDVKKRKKEILNEKMSMQITLERN